MKLLYCRQHSLLVHALRPTAALHDGRRGARARLLLLATLIFFFPPPFFSNMENQKLWYWIFYGYPGLYVFQLGETSPHEYEMAWFEKIRLWCWLSFHDSLRLEQILEEHSAGEHLSLPLHEIMSSPVKRGVQMVEGAYEIIMKNEEEEEL